MEKKKCENKEVCGCRCHHIVIHGNNGNCSACPDCEIIKVALRPCNCQNPEKIPWAIK